jgi:hypothetical protein
MLETGHSRGKIEDVMEILYVNIERHSLNTIEEFHVYDNANESTLKHFRTYA